MRRRSDFSLTHSGHATGIVLRYQYSAEGDEAMLLRISKGLKDAHEQNEQDRSNVAQLKEEDVNSFIYVTDDVNTLPLRHRLRPFTLIDFPGINDAEDSEKQLFFGAIQNCVHQADLIVFVTGELCTLYCFCCSASSE